MLYRRLIEETRQRKVEEEKQMRESLHAAANVGVAMSMTQSFSHSAASGAVGSATGSSATALTSAVQTTGAPAAAAASTAPGASSTKLFRVNTVDREGSEGSPVASRTSLRSHLTGDDSVRASFGGVVRPRPTPGLSPQASPLPSPVKRGSQQPATAQSADGAGAGSRDEAGVGAAAGAAETRNPLNEV